MGSVATTIGYGHIVPKTNHGKLTCLLFTIFAVPLFAILLKHISVYIEDNLIRMTNQINLRASRQIISDNGTKVSKKFLLLKTNVTPKYADEVFKQNFLGSPRLIFKPVKDVGRVNA